MSPDNGWISGSIRYHSMGLVNVSLYLPANNNALNKATTKKLFAKLNGSF